MQDKDLINYAYKMLRMLLKKYELKFNIPIDFSEVESLMLYKLGNICLKRGGLGDGWERYIKIMVQNCIRDCLKRCRKNIGIKIKYYRTYYNRFQ